MMAAPRKVACVEIGGIPIALATSDDNFLDLLRRRYDGFLSFSRPEFELEFDLVPVGSTSEGDVRVRREGDDWLIERGGFLLHAASAICDGRAYLFSGVSGAGKTTMTRLAPADITLLTDEISYLRASADGYAACGTPFAGELAKAGENRTAPVSALFFLEKGLENRVDELSSAEAVRRLMRNILFF